MAFSAYSLLNNKVSSESKPDMIIILALVAAAFQKASQSL